MKIINASRIIGILLVAIAVIGYFTGRAGVFAVGLSALAGIVLLTSGRMAEKQLDLFRKSFAKPRVIGLAALYDWLFMMFFGAATYLNIMVITKKTEEIMQGANFASEAFLDPAAASANTAAIKSFFAYFIGGLAVLAVVGLLLYALSRMMLWTAIAKQKPSWKQYKKYLGLHAVWWLLWSPVIVFLALVAGQAPEARMFLVAAMMLSMYFTLFVQVLFTRKQKMGYSIGHGIGYGISKMPKMVLPAAYALVAYIVLYQLLSLTQYLPAMVWPAVNFVFVVLFINWLRVYLYPIVVKFHD